MKVLPNGRRRVIDGDDVHLYHPDLHEFDWDDDLERCVVTRNDCDPPPREFLEYEE